MAEQRLVDNRYRLDAVLGSGGMGVVWRAFDQRLNRTVAVKEVRFPSTLTAEERAELTKRAMIEAQSAGRLDHPHIVPVYDVLLEDERPFIIMRLIEGRSLDQLVAAEGPLDPVKTAAIGVQLLDALSAAHAAGIVHRDVKPQNIMVTDDGTAWLTDFSIAAVYGTETLTRTGVLLGSPGYIPPERLTSGQTGPPGDLFALGATLYFAVEGVGPFAATEMMAGLLATAVRPHPRPRRAGPLTPVLDALLVKDPDARPDSATARAMLTGAVEAARIAPPPQGDPPSNATTAALSAAGGGAAPPIAPPAPVPRPPVPPPPVFPPPGGSHPPPEPSAAAAGRQRHRLVMVLTVLLLAVTAGLVTTLIVQPGRGGPPGDSSLAETVPPATGSTGSSPTSPGTSPTNTSPTTQAVRPAKQPTQGERTTTSPPPAEKRDPVLKVKSADIALPASYRGDCTDFTVTLTATITMTTGPATFKYDVRLSGGEAQSRTATVSKAAPVTTATFTFRVRNATTGLLSFFVAMLKPQWYESTPVTYQVECVPSDPSTTGTAQPA